MTETERWFLEMASAITGAGQLGPAKAIMKWLREGVEDIGWERMKQVTRTLGLEGGASAMAVLEAAAVDYRDLPGLLQSEAGQTALSQWYSQHEQATEEFRRLALSLIRLMPPATILNIRSSEGANPSWERIWQDILSPVEEEHHDG